MALPESEVRKRGMSRGPGFPGFRLPYKAKAAKKKSDPLPVTETFRHPAALSGHLLTTARPCLCWQVMRNRKGHPDPVARNCTSTRRAGKNTRKRKQTKSDG